MAILTFVAQPHVRAGLEVVDYWTRLFEKARSLWRGERKFMEGHIRHRD
jgi:hypothetical protein